MHATFSILDTNDQMLHKIHLGTASEPEMHDFTGDSGDYFTPTAAEKALSVRPLSLFPPFPLLRSLVPSLSPCLPLSLSLPLSVKLSLNLNP